MGIFDFLQPKARKKERAKIYFKKLQTHIIEGRFDQAIEGLQKIIVLDPDNLDYKSQLGALYFLSKKWNLAEKIWENNLKVQSDHGTYSGA